MAAATKISVARRRVAQPSFDRTKPYNDLPLLPPAAHLETPAVLKAAIRASRSLAELKGRTRTVPNASILLNTIAIQEARASSEIENIFTTSDEIQWTPPQAACSNSAQQFPP